MKSAEGLAKELYQALLVLKTPEEMECFLADLLTKEERLEMARRWWTAKALDQGISYQEIQKTTGLSSTTVARISRWLKRGKNGYRLVIDRLHHTSPSREKASS